MVLPTFVWGSGGSQLSPQEASRQRAIADALFSQNQNVAQDPWSGLAQIARATTGSILDKRAADAEKAGQADIAAALSGLGPSSSFSDIASVLGNGWASPAQQSIAEALMSTSLKQSDPLYQIQLQQARAALNEPPKPVFEGGQWWDVSGGQPAALTQSAPTSAIQNYDYLVANGVDPKVAMDRAFSGGVNVNLPGQANIGTIPPGYAATQGPDGAWTMQPIPGSPAAAEAAAAAAKTDKQSDQASITGDTILNEADKARNLIGAFSTGMGGWALSKLPFTDAGELQQHVDSLKSIAAAENINAMRQASPTGGALGNASDADIALLKDKAGALNPASRSFPQQLDDYERTLLRIVHGPEAGDRIYEQSRKGAGDAAKGPTVGQVEDGWRFKGGDPKDQNNWEIAR